MSEAVTNGTAPHLLPPPLPIRTDRLVLRAVVPEDTAAMSYCSDPEVTRYLPFGVLDSAGLAARVARMVAATAPSAPEESLALAVEHEDGLAGDLMLAMTDRRDETSPPSIAELGWVFSPSYGGRGLATEAARALVDLAFEHYPLHRLFARLHPHNERSARLCERLGMTHEAHLRRDFAEPDGTWGDTVVYGLLREEWADRRA